MERKIRVRENTLVTNNQKHATPRASPSSGRNASPRDARLLTRVRMKNYRSVEACDVELGPLTFLVGPNGSGKSNFLDALRFTSDALRGSLDQALRERGGIQQVRRRTGRGRGRPPHFGVRLDFRLPPAAGRAVGRPTTGFYAFEIGALAGGGFHVLREECSVVRTDASGERTRDYFEMQKGAVTGNHRVFDDLRRAQTDRLLLSAMTWLPPFGAVSENLAGMGFYNLNPAQIREPQSPSDAHLLARDGSNLAAVVRRMGTARATKQRIEDYLQAIVPGIVGVQAVTLGSKETLEFHQQARPGSAEVRFQAESMSDGTLRALGVLAALFQTRARDNRVSFVGMEEPELGLHPAAVGVLVDALRDASHTTQVLVTSHGADLLDNDDIRSDMLRAVALDTGATEIAPIDEVSRSALRDRLYTAGDLLRMGQLTPEGAPARSIAPVQLFDPGTAA